MIIAPRFLASALAAFLLAGFASAQVEVAPPPHPTLDDVVKEYIRLELPLAPFDAELVRREEWQSFGPWVPPEQMHKRKLVASLGFKLPPLREGGRPRIRYFWQNLFPVDVHPHELKAVRPTAEAAAGIEAEPLELASLAVQCKLLGWDELAARLYRQSLDGHEHERHTMDVRPALQARACAYAEYDLFRPGTDRRILLARLQRLVRDCPQLRNAERERLLRQLEAAVEHRSTAKPGSIEALIDDLSEFHDSRYGQGEAYWKLIEAGFDAVPALIEHLGDDRLTRADSRALANSDRDPYELTVGHICSRILFDLSWHRIEYDTRSDAPMRADRAREWFEQAKKIGEAKWLADEIVTHETMDGSMIRQQLAMARAISAKQPERLAVIYRDSLRISSFVQVRDHVDAVVASRLKREEKIALLEEGAANPRMEHAFLAIQGLEQLDLKIARKQLLAVIRRIGTAEEHEADVFAESIPGVFRTHADVECWDALAVAVRSQPPKARHNLVHWMTLDDRGPETLAVRSERLRFLMKFIDDREQNPKDRESWELGDSAAISIERTLDLYESEWLRWEPPSRLWRLVLRSTAARHAQREIARLRHTDK